MNLQYFGDAGLIHGGSFASKDGEDYQIMTIWYDDDSRMQPNVIHVKRDYVWADDIEDEVLADFNGMTPDEYKEFPEFMRAIDHVNYYSQDSDWWSIILPFEGDDPFFFDDDNETILKAIQGEGIGMNGILVTPEWENAMSNTKEKSA